VNAISWSARASLFTFPKHSHRISNVHYRQYPLNELTITIGGRLTCHQKVCRSRCHARRQPNGSRGDDPRSILVLEPDLTIRFANRSFCHTFAVAPEHTVGRKLYEIGNGQWDIPKLRTSLDTIISGRKTIETFEVEHFFPSIGQRIMVLNARTV
jgi:PAS fold